MQLEQPQSHSSKEIDTKLALITKDPNFDAEGTPRKPVSRDNAVDALSKGVTVACLLKTKDELYKRMDDVSKFSPESGWFIIKPGVNKETVEKFLATKPKMGQVDFFILPLVPVVSMDKATTAKSVSQEDKGRWAIREYFGLSKDATDEELDAAEKRSGDRAIRKYFDLPEDATDEELDAAEKLAAAKAREQYAAMVREDEQKMKKNVKKYLDTTLPYNPDADMTLTKSNGFDENIDSFEERMYLPRLQNGEMIYLVAPANNPPQEALRSTFPRVIEIAKKNNILEIHITVGQLTFSYDVQSGQIKDFAVSDFYKDTVSTDKMRSLTQDVIDSLNNPRREADPTKMLVLNNSPILDRVKYSLLNYRGSQDPIPTDIKIVDVIVDKSGHTSVEVQMNWAGRIVSVAFGVEEGKSFGAADEAPLTPQEYNLVMSFARLVEPSDEVIPTTAAKNPERVKAEVGTSAENPIIFNPANEFIPFLSEALNNDLLKTNREMFIENRSEVLKLYYDVSGELRLISIKTLDDEPIPQASLDGALQRAKALDSDRRSKETYRQPEYIFTHEQLNEVSLGNLGKMVPGTSYEQFMTQAREVALAKGIKNPKLLIALKYKPEKNTAEFTIQSGDSSEDVQMERPSQEAVYPIADFEWQDLIDDVPTYLSEDPQVHVVDGDKYTAGI